MRGRAIPTALLLGGGFIVAADLRVAAPLLPAIADDFNTSVGVAGWTIGVYGTAYAAGQFFYGRFGDRVGKIRVIRIALLMFAVGTGLCAVAPSLPVLLGLRLVTGAVAAGVVPMSLAYLGDTIEDYTIRRRAIGVFLSCLVTGQVFGQAFGGILAGLFSWRAIFLLIGAIGLVLAAAFWRYPVAPAATRPVASRWSFRQIFASDRPLFMLAIVETFIFQGAFSFAGASLVEQDDASYPLVGTLLALFAVGSIAASRMLSRFAGSKTDGSRVAFGAIGMAAGLALLVAPPGPALFGLSVFTLGLGFTVAHSTLQARGTEVSPAARGAAVSLFAGFASVGGAAGTFAAGAVVDAAGFDTLFVAAALAMAAFALAAGRGLPARRERVATAG